MSNQHDVIAADSNIRRKMYSKKNSFNKVWLPNCHNPKFKSNPECMCRYPTNWDKDICQGENWWARKDIVENVKKASARIVGGENAPYDAYPWFARLTDRNGNWAGCGGMLVAPQYVLTAAHCVAPNTSWSANVAAVQIGAVCPTSSTNCGQPVQQINVERIIAHPDYNTQTLNNDYALVKLVSRANATPVEMDQGQYVDNYQNNKRNLYSIGFGALSSGGSTPSQLKHVELAHIPRTECNGANAYNGEITENMMCAADPGQDSCQGDSGGPLYDADNKVLVGVVSWGYGCAMPQYPGVYAQVSKRWSWIKTNICDSHSNPKPSFCGPASPTASPTPACSNNKLNVKVSVTTDNYPEEISWIIEDASGSTIAKEDSFTGDLTTYEEQLCLDPSVCYKFTINDSYGDGIIGDGDFTFTVDGVIKLSNPDSGFTSKETEFGNCSSGSTPTAAPTSILTPPPTTSPTTASIPTTPNPTDGPTKNPTDTPTDSPTDSPTKAPSPAPTSQVCNGSQFSVNILFKTDNYPSENSWTLDDSSGTTVAVSEKFTQKVTTYEKDLCVSADKCYIFTIKDSYGDGLFDEGDFAVTVDGVKILSKVPYEQWSEKDVQFGACTSEPTESPTTPPTKYPTVGPTANPTEQPTAALTSSCATDKSEVLVSVTTDSYPGEVSWELSTVGGNTITSSDFADRYTTYESTICVNPVDCHKFVIKDSYGDGLLSGGDFTLTVDGNQLLSDTIQGWNKLEAEFGQCGSSNPTTCTSDEFEVEVSVTTDNYPQELSWKIFPINGDTGPTINSEKFDESFTTYVNSYCLSKSICHRFVIRDTYGDGITAGGDFTLAIDNQVRLQDTNSGWSVLRTKFGAC